MRLNINGRTLEHDAAHHFERLAEFLSFKDAELIADDAAARLVDAQFGTTNLARSGCHRRYADLHAGIRNVRMYGHMRSRSLGVIASHMNLVDEFRATLYPVH